MSVHKQMLLSKKKIKAQVRQAVAEHLTGMAATLKRSYSLRWPDGPGIHEWSSPVWENIADEDAAIRKELLRIVNLINGDKK